MKLPLSFLSTALLVPFSEASSDLARLWNIDDPVVDKNGNTFAFNYGNITADHITTIETQVQATMYGADCKVDGAATYGQMGIITNNPTPGEPFELTSLAYDNTGYDTNDGTGNIKYEFRMFPSTMSDRSDFNSLLSSTANIDVSVMSFCVRFGLFIGTDEVNFLESQVKITITVNFSFELLDVSPKPREQGGISLAQEYKVVAALCPNQPAQFNQGAAIQVCLAPDGPALLDGMLITSVDSFTWERSGVIGASQSAVNEDEAAEKNAEALDGLSVITVQDDQKQIMVTTILYAAFYESTGTATASGSATTNFSEVDDDEDEDSPDAIVRNRNRNRRLVRDYNNNKQRSLQQQQPQQAFDINVDLNVADDGPLQVQTSGGAGFATTNVGVGVVAAAAATVGIVISTILFA